MGRKRLLKITSVYKLTAGTLLAEPMTATSPADGERLSVESVADFNAKAEDGSGGGGTAVIGSEVIAYDDVDEDTDELVGVLRGFEGTIAAVHADGVFVQEGTEPTVEKWARGKLDDEEEIREIPVPSYLYPLLRVGTYADETAPAIPVYFDDDEDEVIVLDGPLGAVPTFDEDLEVLPPVGGGNSTTATTDPDTGKVLPPAGMGYEDGKPPSTDVVPTLVGGIGTLFVRFPTIANNSQVTYKIHVHTTTGFTPAANTQVGTLVLAGTPGFTGVVSIKDFPTGHVLDATVSDPPVAGTTYYAKVVASDGSGDFAGPHSQASGTPVKVATADVIAGSITADLLAAGAVTATKITDGSISTPKLAAGAVTAVKITAGAITANEIATGTITSDQIAGRSIIAGDIVSGTLTANEIAGSTITADRLFVSSLSAISANIGTITAGSITGVTITGALIRTAASGTRVELSSGANSNAIAFYDGVSSSSGYISVGTGTMTILPPNSGTRATVELSGTKVYFDGDIEPQGIVRGLKVNTIQPGVMGTNDVSIYYNPTFGANGAMIFKKPSGVYIALEFQAANRTV